LPVRGATAAASDVGVMSGMHSNISRGFNFANLGKICEICENFPSQKFLKPTLIGIIIIIL